MQFEQTEGLQSQENATANKTSPLWLRHKTALVLFASFFAILMLLSLAISGNRRINRTVVPIVTPPVVVITVTPPADKSPWASSEAVLKMENDNRSLTNSLLNVDLVESALALPNVDMNVSFEK